MALLRDACQSGKRDFVGWPVFSKNGVHDVSLRLVLSCLGRCVARLIPGFSKFRARLTTSGQSFDFLF
jgi:hypothetical protein